MSLPYTPATADAVSLPHDKKKRPTYLRPASRIEHDVRLSCQLAQPVSPGLLDLDADASPWEMTTDVLDALEECLRDATLL